MRSNVSRATTLRGVIDPSVNYLINHPWSPTPERCTSTCTPGITVVGIVIFQASVACPNGATGLGVAVNDTSTASASIWISRTCSGSIGGNGSVPVVLVVPVVPGPWGFAITTSIQGIGNMNGTRRRSPVLGPRQLDVISQTRTLAA